MDLENMNYPERVKIAENTNTSADILRELAKDKNHLVRGRVAQHLNTPVEVLRDLAKDEDYGTRASVSRNPNTPNDVLLYFTKMIIGGLDVMWHGIVIPLLKFCGY